VDLLIRELPVRAGAVIVEAAGVPGERHGAPLETERVPAVHVEREAETERRGNGDAARRRERLIIGDGERVAVGVRGTAQALRAAAAAHDRIWPRALVALRHARDGRPGKEIEIRVDVDALKQGDLAAERDERDL